MTKHEVAAALCRAGIEAGLWSIPEFEIAGGVGTSRKLDVVWAVRESDSAGCLWRPVAAFEIEGHGVARSSLAKNADSLRAAQNAGARVCAMILFQVGPTGAPWVPKRELRETERILGGYLTSAGGVEVLLDESLNERLGAWSSLVAS